MVGVVVGEVEVGVDAVEGPGGGVVGAGGVLLVVEQAEILRNAVFLDLTRPLISLSVPGDARVRRGGVRRAAAVGVVLADGAVAQVGLAVVLAVVVDVVADQAVGRVHDLAVHVNPLGAAVDLDGAHGVDRVRADLGAPAELRQPDVVLGIDLREPALAQRDAAVIAELVVVDGQVVPRPVVGGERAAVGAAELAADVRGVDAGPAGLAGGGVEHRRIPQAVQRAGEVPAEVTAAALTLDDFVAHSARLCARREKIRASIIGTSAQECVENPTPVRALASL